VVHLLTLSILPFDVFPHLILFFIFFGEDKVGGFWLVVDFGSDAAAMVCNFGRVPKGLEFILGGQEKPPAVSRKP
jgi:hypothetical protein